MKYVDCSALEAEAVIEVELCAPSRSRIFFVALQAHMNESSSESESDSGDAEQSGTAHDVMVID